MRETAPASLTIVSRREQIRMSAHEVESFLGEERTVTCATIGPRGWPHLTPLWYVLRDPPDGEPGPRLWAWTYAVSQKVRNLERDPRASLQVEAGEAYGDLRGVMLECDVVIHRELDAVAPLGMAILLRSTISDRSLAQPPAELPGEARDAVTAQAAKRVGLEFVERQRATWDHRKLAGVY